MSEVIKLRKFHSLLQLKLSLNYMFELISLLNYYLRTNFSLFVKIKVNASRKLKSLTTALRVKLYT
jgi:hypothetical protein